jgi:TonB family protein
MRSSTLTILLAALVALPVNVAAQTKEAPLLLYKGDGPNTKPTRTVIPRYPRSATTGSMILEVTIRPDGNVDSVKAIRPLRGATDAAIASVKRWRFQPVIFKGTPAWAVIDLQISTRGAHTLLQCDAVPKVARLPFARLNCSRRGPTDGCECLCGDS